MKTFTTLLFAIVLTIFFAFSVLALFFISHDTIGCGIRYLFLADWQGFRVCAVTH